MDLAAVAIELAIELPLFLVRQVTAVFLAVLLFLLVDFLVVTLDALRLA